MENCKFFVLTGDPGVGKTTIIQKVCELLSERCIPHKGFFTAEKRENGARTGFDIVTIKGERSPLANMNSSKKGPKVGRYTVDVSSFEKLALHLLTLETGIITVVDEIGKMELLSDPFKQKVCELISNEAILLATIPVPKGAQIPIVEMIRTHRLTKLSQVTRANRHEIPNQVVTAILSTNFLADEQTL